MKNRRTLFLGVLGLLSLLNVLYILWFYKTYRYLPPPFIFDKENTFMDFYNTLYWSGQDGIYNIWYSVYPPLNFLLLRVYQFIFLGDSYGLGDGFAIRNAVGGNIDSLLIIYVLSLLAAVSLCFSRVICIRTQITLFFLFLLSPAFLFAIERGNIILLCIPVLSWFVVSKSQISKALGLAVLINLKPYFSIFYIVQLFNVRSHKENKELLFLTPVFALIIFLVTGLYLNQEYYLLPLNLLGFATNSALLSPAEALSFPSSIASFFYFSGLVSEFSVPPILGHLLKLLVYFYLIKALILIYRNKLDFEDLAIFSIIFLTNYSTSTGGYGLLYYIPALALLYKQKDYFLVTLIMVSMYVGIWDLIPIYHYKGGEMNVFLSGELVYIEPYISLGSIIRPVTNFIVLILFINNLKKRNLNERI